MTNEFEQAADTPIADIAHVGPLTADPEFKPPAPSRFDIESARAARAAVIQPPHEWRDGSEPTLAPMPEAPTLPPSEVDNAIAFLNNSTSDGHSGLVARWGDDFGANLAYAKAGFKELVANRPDLIAKVDKAGLGDDPAVLEHLAQFGRQQAGMTGNFTIARTNPPTEPAFVSRAGPPTVRSTATFGSNRGSEETRSELGRLIRENPPGSPGYAEPQTQARIQQLHRTIAGSGSPVGTNGRTA